MFDLITQWLQPFGGWAALVGPAVPFVIALLKRVIDTLPKPWIPALAAFTGFLLHAVTALTETVTLNPILGVALGLLGVGLREVYDKVFRGVEGVEGVEGGS